MEVENPAAACECTERHDRAERRNLMLITSVVLQWMLMLVCIVYLVVLYHQSHQEPPLKKEFVITELQDLKDDKLEKEEVTLKRTDGNMTVHNGYIEIYSQGFYLLNAQGYTKDKYKEGNITFHFDHGGDMDLDTWMQPVLQGTVKVTLIKKLYRDSKVSITKKNLKFENFELTMFLVEGYF